MTNRPLISVIVPVYNVANYVEECIRSILAQTYTNLEIILVDDGSTDCSGSICDQLAVEDCRITVIHKENGGVSRARNEGLRSASGLLVGFVDPDDWVSPVYFDALYETMSRKNAGMAAVSGGHEFWDGELVSLEDDLDSALSKAILLDQVDYQRLLLYQSVDNGLPLRICRREDLGVDPFPVGYLYEDLATTYVFARNAGRIALIESRDLYAYRQRPTSILRRSFSHEKAQSSIVVSRKLFDDITCWYPSLVNAAHSRCFSMNRAIFAQCPASEAEDKTALWAELCEHRRPVFSDPHARKRERFAAGISLMGATMFSMFCWVARRIGKMR